MTQVSPTLTIILAQEDFDDLSGGDYKLRYTRQVVDSANNNKPLGVWAYQPLGESKIKGLTTKSTTTPPWITFDVSLTNLTGEGDIKYKLSYLKVGDKLADIISQAGQNQSGQSLSEKEAIQTSLGNDSLEIKKRAIDIVESQSYEIDTANDNVIRATASTESWPDIPWTFGFDNHRSKVRPIILRQEGAELSVFYLGSWWITGKGRMSLPQKDRVSIWFANTGGDDTIDVRVEDFSEPMALVLQRGKPYKIKYSQGVWGQPELVAVVAGQ